MSGFRSPKSASIAVLSLISIAVTVMLKYKIDYIYTNRLLRRPIEAFFGSGALYNTTLALQSGNETLHRRSNRYDVLERIHLFNKAIEMIRQQEFLTTKSEKWAEIESSSKVRLIHGGQQNFLEIVSNFSQVRTVSIPWLTDPNTTVLWSSLNDSSNLLVQKYYDWSASDPLCHWIETPGLIRRAYVITCNRSCLTDPKKTRNPIAVPVVSLYDVTIDDKRASLNEGSVFPPHFYSQPPEILSYMHMIRHGLITGTGEVYSKDIKIVPFGCMANSDINPPTDTTNIVLYNEVFVISQFWGNAVFHRMIEVMPRISIYLELLHRNTQIMIHSPSNQGPLIELLEVLGINISRIVTGLNRANIVYLPRATLCGYANHIEIQLLSKHYRDYITSNLRIQPRDQIVLIRRSHDRRFTEQSAIETVVQSAAEAHGLRYTIFPDNPTPSLKETMVIFQSAVVVVAPHGAGLSNIIFSEPGTIVIEGVCNRPHVNLCFLRTAFILGMSWHGIPSRGGCEGVVDISASVINDTLIGFLDTRTK